MEHEGQQGREPQTPPAGPARYAFTPPEVPPKIEFKRVRREPGKAPQKPARRGPGEPRLRRWHLLTAAGLVLALILSLGWVGVDGWRAKGHLENAAGLFSQLQQQVQRGDLVAARGTLSALQSETRAARENTGGFGWTLIGKLPAVGDDLSAVRTVAYVLDDLAGNGLPALLDVAAGLDPQRLAPRNGRIDLTALNAAAPRIARGLMVIRRAQTGVAGIDTAHLAAPLASAITELRSGLDHAERIVATADRAARLLPPMLGANGPRTYLVLFQNNAEVRATGGMPGAYLVIHADAGAVTIADQGTAGDLHSFPVPVQNLSVDMEALYTTRPAVYPADVNLTPDFPTAAVLARSMYAKHTGVTVDGVVATDPIALSYLLRVTGPVRLPKGGSLTADNAVRTLLSEAYAKYPDPSVQDAFFAGAARDTFNALIRGQGNPKGIITELARAAGERRLLMWSADATEEAALAGTVVQGRLPDDDSAAPTVGVFLNDGSGGKLSYYLTQAADLGDGSCTEDGDHQLHLKLTLGSTAPAAGLPAYVTGLALSGDPYTVRTNAMVFSPVGGGIVGVTLDGKEVEFGSGVERERGVAVFTVDLRPGSSQTFDITIQAGDQTRANAAFTPRLWTTPGVRPWKTTVTAGTPCAGT
ncbi:DUF4012 domain-containing protein [Krasilnikovia sp. MM14-A1259]|uniref:DUF4012 domain-containing protein n=1 Tax=Krasilnikovia sp. MM14-A1259 TaxID=3373539 RepID=UPI00382C112C